MGYHYNYYYYHSSIPYLPKVLLGDDSSLNGCQVLEVLWQRKESSVKLPLLMGSVRRTPGAKGRALFL